MQNMHIKKMTKNVYSYFHFRYTLASRVVFILKWKANLNAQQKKNQLNWRQNKDEGGKENRKNNNNSVGTDLWNSIEVQFSIFSHIYFSLFSTFHAKYINISYFLSPRRPCCSSLVDHLPLPFFPKTIHLFITESEQKKGTSRTRIEKKPKQKNR